MSSFPLISHHLFVAAVTPKGRASRAPGRNKAPAPTSKVQVRELSLELVDFGRPLPAEPTSPFEGVRWFGST